MTPTERDALEREALFLLLRIAYRRGSEAEQRMIDEVLAKAEPAKAGEPA